MRSGELAAGLGHLRPVVGVQPRRRRQVHQQLAAVVLGGVHWRAHQRQMGVEGQRLGLLAIDRSGHLDVALAHRLADRGVSSGCGLISMNVLWSAAASDGTAETDRVAQVGHPVLGTEHRCATGAFGRVDHRNPRTDRRQIPQSGAQLGQDRVDGGVVGCHVDLDSAGQQTLGTDLAISSSTCAGGPAITDCVGEA